MLEKCLLRVKDFATDMATRNATPFLHRYLYRDYTPQSILACFATSMLYANRTPANTPMVMRALHGTVRELVDAEPSCVTATPSEKFARAQALFLYQVIRLFDGDVYLRSQAERDMPLFQTWLGELCKVRENLGDSVRLEDGATRSLPSLEWEVRITCSLPPTVYIIAYSAHRNGYLSNRCAGPSLWHTRSSPYTP